MGKQQTMVLYGIPNPLHPRYSEYENALIAAYKAWHDSEYGKFSDDQDRVQARETAKQLRAEEDRLFAIVAA